jgi:hypothetical protein
VQDRVAELEARLAQTCAELATSRAVEVRLQQRLAGSKTAAEVEALYARLDGAEAAAARADDNTAALTLRAEEAERRTAEALAQRQRHLADLTSLRWGSEGRLSCDLVLEEAFGCYLRVTMTPVTWHSKLVGAGGLAYDCRWCPVSRVLTHHV